MTSKEQQYFKIIEALLIANNSFNSGDFVAVVGLSKVNAKKWWKEYRNEFQPDVLYCRNEKRFKCLAGLKVHLINRRDAINIVKVATFLYNDKES